MKKSLWIILLLVSSLIFVSCATDTPDDMDTTNQGSEEHTVREERTDEDGSAQDKDGTPSDTSKFSYNIDDIKEFELEIELLNDNEIDYKFDGRDNEAKVERENGQEMVLTGQDAIDEVFSLLESIEINLERPLSDMIEDVLNYLEIAMDELDQLELEIQLNDSEEIGFKYDREESSENRTVENFELDIDFRDGREWDFDYDLEDNEYEIEGVAHHTGEEAKIRIEELIDAIEISLDSTIGQMKDNLLNHLDINEEDLENFDFDLEYVDGMEIDVKLHY